MRALALALLWAAASGARQEPAEEFDSAKVNRWIVSLSEDPSQESAVAELHDYLKKHGKFGLLVSKFEESFERRPRDARLRYLLGQLHLRDGNRAAAVKCFQAAVQADPEYSYTYLAQAEVCRAQGDEKGLVAALEGVLQASREKGALSGAARQLTSYYAKRQELDRVASIWAAVADRFPDDAGILDEAVQGILSTGRVPRAREVLRSGLSRKLLPPADLARLYLELAALERRTGSPSEAAKALAAASESAGEDAVLSRRIDESILAFYRDESRLGELAELRARELASSPADPVRLWRLAGVYLAQGTTGKARELLTNGLRIQVGHPLLLSALADVAAREGKFAEVRDLVLQLLVREPQQREHRKRLGTACLELGKDEEAEKAFASYAVTAAEFAEVARLYERRQKLAAAVPYFVKSIELGPDPALSRVLVGVYVRLDRPADAEREAARCTSTLRERWALLRELLQMRGDLVGACAYARKDAEANPKDVGALVVLGRLLAAVKHPEAEPTLRQALAAAKKGERGAVYEELADLAASRGPKAILEMAAELRVQLKEQPEEGGLYYALYRLPAGAEFRGSNPAWLLEQGRKVDPRHVKIRQELAPYCVQQKQYDVAIDIYKELLEIDSARRETYCYAIGEVYWSLGHKDEAFSWWAKISPSSKEHVGLSFQLAKKFESEKRYPQAIELLEKVVREAPEVELYHWALGQLYRQVHQLDGIEREYKWLVAHAKDEQAVRTARQVLAEKLQERGRALSEKGDHAGAMQAFDEALRHSPDDPATGSLIALMARSCELARDFARAAQQYHLILSKYSSAVVAVGEGRTMNAGLFASLQLRANLECLRAYEDAVGGPAKALLMDALQKGDRAGMERVITVYPLSQAAGLAAYSLGEACRKDGDRAKAAWWFERLLTEFSFAGVDEALVRVRLVELATQMKDWPLLSLHLGELAARFKDKMLTVDGRSVAVREVVKAAQRDLLVHGIGLGASWGLLGRDSRSSSSTVQELAPPLVSRWKVQVVNPNSNGTLPNLPPVYVSGGLVLVSKDDTLTAYDASSGSVRWTAPLRIARGRMRGAHPFTGTAVEGRLAAAQGVVVGVDGDNELRAFEVSTGALLWSHATDVPRSDGIVPQKPGAKVRTGTTVTPIEHLEVLSATRQCFIVREASKLRAFSIRTGRLEWSTEVSAAGFPFGLDPSMAANGAGPERLDRMVLEADGVLIHAYGDSIRALDSLSGKDLWEVKVPGKGPAGSSSWGAYFTLVTEGVARATISGDLLVYLAASTGKLTALELRTGRLRWSVPGEGPATEGQLASDDQYVYVGRNAALTVCLVKTGEAVWTRELRAAAPARVAGVPPLPTSPNRFSVAGSRVFLTTAEDQTNEGAKVEAIDRKDGKTGWTFVWEPIGRLLQGLRVLGTDAWGRPIATQISAPVICDGWLYVVRSDGCLYAFHGKAQELASLREAIRTDPESPIAHFRLGDLLGAEGSTGLEIEEYRTALKLSQKKQETAALKELVAEIRSRLFVRLMKQGESSPDLEAGLKAFAEARTVADGESSMARVLVRTAAALLALNRELQAVDVLSSILTHCASAPSPLDGSIETAGEYARRQLGRLGPPVRAQWEKAHAEEVEKAFAAGRSVEELEKSIERFSFSSKADEARVRVARLHVEAKRFKEALETLDRIRPEFLAQADAETFFEAYDLMGRTLAELGEDRRALGTYQKMVTEIAKDEARLGAIKARAEARHKELKESWERNGTFSTPLKTIWASPAPVAGGPKPAGPTLSAFRPVIDCGKIYQLDLQGTLQAIDAGTGQVVWLAATEEMSPLFQAANNLTVLPFDPLVAVRNGIVVAGGKLVRAFDATTGKFLWSMSSVDGDGIVHQVLFEGSRLVTCDTKGRVCVREDRTGKLLWTNRPGASATGIITDRSGTCGGGLLYSHVGTDGNRVVVQPAGDPGCLYAYDLVSGKLVWKVTDASYTGYLKGRVILEVGYGMVCLADPTGLVVCHDLADGKVRWKLNLTVPIEAVLPTPDRVVLATLDQVAAYGAKSGRRDWVLAQDAASTQVYSRDKDMRIGATSLDAKGRWLVTGGAGGVSIVELASGALKDQLRLEGQATPGRPSGKTYPFGRSFAGVAVGPEGIFCGVSTDYGTQWTLLR